MKFLLVHDSSIRVDSIKVFFGELYEHFIKVNQFIRICQRMLIYNIFFIIL